MSLNSDLLRTFLAIAEAGSVTGGARRIGRSQSATSLQVRQLEHVVGQAVFRRHGRGTTLTAAGEHLLPVAREVTRSLDRTLAELRGEPLTGRLRVGIPDGHGQTILATIIAEFADRNPDVELEIRCAFGMGFEVALKTGALDIAVHEVAAPSPGDEVLRRDNLVWMNLRGRDLGAEPVLPVALFDRDCWWRDAAIDGLEAAGQRYKVVFTSESAMGVDAAVRTGIAAGLYGNGTQSADLVPVRGLDARLPTCLVLRTADDLQGAAGAAMRATIRDAFAARNRGDSTRQSVSPPS